MTSCTGSVGWGFLGFEKKERVEFLAPNERVEIQSWARPDEFVHYGRPTLVGSGADDVKAVSIERLCVSLSLSSCQITFNSKVIKFRTWTNSVNFVFPGFLCLWTTMNVFPHRGPCKCNNLSFLQQLHFFLTCFSLDFRSFSYEH